MALASAVTAMLVAATATVAVRSVPGPSTLAFLSSTRVAGPAPPPKVSGPLSEPKSLDAALAAIGYKLPPGADVYAARVTKTGAGLSYEAYQGGGGALDKSFWPASSIKVLAAVGALEYLNKQGFTGAASVTFADTGITRTVRSIYDAALRDSSNADYDLLVQIAGVDWLNKEFLTVARGFPATVIQTSYTGGDLTSSPAMSLAESTRKLALPARSGHFDDDCPAGNCSDLFEMSESVRRIVLNDEIPEPERFRVARADVVGLTNALRGADGYFAPAVARVLGTAARVYSKPGFAPSLDCLDVTLIEFDGQRLLLSATVPNSQGGCPALVNIAAGVLALLKSPGAGSRI